jgi:tetraacyldisaccharide 4'-kinase
MPPLSAPDFWSHAGLASNLLQPFAWSHAAAGAARRALARPWRAPVPTLCVGNLVAGGAGKTPVALSLARWFAERGVTPHLLSRGYGGREAGPVAVDPARHDAAAVGDEPLLLAAAAPVWVARDRVAGAKAAVAAGAGILLLDDGFQNPSLAKDLSLLVIDGGYGVGNGRVLPAGPLREPIAWGLARADAIVLIGEDATGVLARLPGKPVLHARLTPADGGDLAGRPVVAFAGIGRPAKFFATLEALGADLVARHGFPDHHAYANDELARLLGEAEAKGATVVTTAKDAVRLAPSWRARIRVLSVDLTWDEPRAMAALLARILGEAGGNG